MNPHAPTAPLRASFILCCLVWSAAGSPVAADRTCRVDVSGESDSQGEVTVLTEKSDQVDAQGFPVLSRVDVTIPMDTTAVGAAVLVAAAIANGSMVGVVGATSAQDEIVVILNDGASISIRESIVILGQFYSLPTCTSPPAVRPPAKIRVDLSARRIVVPNGDRTWRPVRWTVKNIGNAALPAGFQVKWIAAGEIALRRDVHSGSALGQLPPRASRSFVVEARIAPPRPAIQRGQARAFPNMDPPLDDPRLLPFEIEEGPSECVTGRQPSATLLFPYFEVDLDDAAGVTTLLAVTNSDAACRLTRLTLWTDQGVPTLTSYIYLSPNDVQTINLRDVFAGTLPDTSATLSNPECPVLDRPICEAKELQTEILSLALKSTGPIHAGSPDPETGACAAGDRGDGVARGYATVDVVHTCAYPPTTRTWERKEWEALDGFFAATGTAFDNVLWGDYFLVDTGQNFAQGESAVHVPADPDRLDDGEYTFYGRYVGFDASDGRLPLGRRYRSRFINGGAFDGGTTLLIWRDSRSPSVAPRDCAGAPVWAPLGEAAVAAFDEDETRRTMAGLASLCPAAADGLSFECSLETIGPDPLFGFLDLDLAHGDGIPAQAWVTYLMSASGRFSVGASASAVDDLCDWAVTPGGSEVVDPIEPP